MLFLRVRPKVVITDDHRPWFGNPVGQHQIFERCGSMVIAIDVDQVGTNSFGINLDQFVEGLAVVEGHNVALAGEAHIVQEVLLYDVEVYAGDLRVVGVRVDAVKRAARGLDEVLQHPYG